MRGKLTAFPYFGGKNKHLGFIIPALKRNGIEHFVDAYGGAASISLNCHRYFLQTYNDLNSDIVRFFRVLRDDGDRLMDALRKTPMSREEFRLACEEPYPECEVETARRFFVKAVQAVGGMGTKATPGTWGYNVAARGLATGRWVGYDKKLPLVAERLRSIQIENRPALELIERYGQPEVLIYCDPPYIMRSRSGRGYKHEMTDAQHEELLNALERARIMGAEIALSGYANDLYDDFLAERKWRRTENEETPCYAKALTLGDKRDRRREVLWTTYDAASVML